MDELTTEPLVHIGYYKTGTTWLQRRIFPEPTLGFLSPESMLRIDETFVTLNPFTFDSATAHARFQAQFVEADARGLVPVISQERLCGLPTRIADAPVIADRLAAAFPSGRVLIVIREQPGMMISTYKWQIQLNSAEAFEAFWRTGKNGEFAPKLERFEFHHLIAHYQRLFGRERVLVLPFEWLRRDAAVFVGEIAKFVGIPAPLEVPVDRENISVTSAMAVTLRYVNLGLRTLGLLRMFEGPMLERRMRRMRFQAVQRLNPRRAGTLSRRIDRRWREIAMDLGGRRFAESNKVTAELTGLDLGSLGYPGWTT